MHVPLSASPVTAGSRLSGWTCYVVVETLVHLPGAFALPCSVCWEPPYKVTFVTFPQDRESLSGD